MALIDFLRQVDSDIETVLSDDFDIEITRTRYVPTFDDPGITYDNLTDGKKKVKLLESCVLYVDIRNSASISVSSEPERLARMYSAFVKNMIAAARHFKGHVRNIIGDRVMVVFDRENCFENAYNTAVLMHTISKYIINKRIKGIDFKCGIGIDFGEMMIAKAGAVRHGAETEFYRSLVWLGRPANVASRLTDLAHKSGVRRELRVHVAYWKNEKRDLSDDWVWAKSVSAADFVRDLEYEYKSNIVHSDPLFANFFSLENSDWWEHDAILVTEDFLSGFREENPEHHSFTKDYFRESSAKVKEYKGKIYGMTVYYTAVNDL